MYAWKQVDPSDILPHTLDDNDSSPLLSIHSGIQLEDLDIPETDRQIEYMQKHVLMLREVVKQYVSCFI